MTEETTKLLNLMRFWIFGTFLIVAAAVLVAGFFYTRSLSRVVFLVGACGCGRAVRGLVLPL
jgi:hypothetical protein